MLTQGEGLFYAKVLLETLKFIERNWGLPTISGRSRDNLPSPTYNTAVSLYPQPTALPSATYSTSSTSNGSPQRATLCE
jgi:hypothetical protein